MKNIFLFFIFLFISSASVAGEITVPIEYSKEQLQQIFDSPYFKGIQNSINGVLEKQPEEKKKVISDMEVAFRWGSDWGGLNAFLERHKIVAPIYAAIDSDQQFQTERYVPPRLKNKKEDVVLDAHWLKINNRAVSDAMIAAFPERFVALNKALPGFLVWLFEGFWSVPWVVVDKPFTEEFCKNSHVYKVRQQIAACQTPQMIKVQKSFYNGTTQDPQKRASIFFHELIRYKVMLLAQVSYTGQAEQDALTARLSHALLDPQVEPTEFYKILGQAQLIPSGDILESLRQYELSLLINQKMVLIRGLIKFNSECAKYGHRIDNLFLPMVDKVIQNITECRRYLREDDDDLCETKTLAFHVADYGQRCSKPPPK